MKTKKRVTPYWHRTLAEALRRGYATAGEANKAMDWVTCACGRQDVRIPRDPHITDGRPADPDLVVLGSSFGASVCRATKAGVNSSGSEARRRFELRRAKKLLLRIEARAAEILAGLSR